MGSNIANNLECEYIEYALWYFILVHISDLTYVHLLCPTPQVPACFGFTIVESLSQIPNPFSNQWLKNRKYSNEWRGVNIDQSAMC